MASKKVSIPGSERRPAGTRVGDVPNDELVDVSVILKPKTPMHAPQSGGAIISREEFAARYGADPRAIEQVVALEAREERVALGDTLPAGLRLIAEDP